MAVARGNIIDKDDLEYQGPWYMQSHERLRHSASHVMMITVNTLYLYDSIYDMCTLCSEVPGFAIKLLQLVRQTLKRC